MFADSNGGVPHVVKFSPAAKHDAESAFTGDLFQDPIEFCNSGHDFITFLPGLATGLPRCTGAGSLPCALRLSPLRKKSEQTTSLTLTLTLPLALVRLDARVEVWDALNCLQNVKRWSRVSRFADLAGSFLLANSDRMLTL